MQSVVELEPPVPRQGDKFVHRSRCINCTSTRLELLSWGRFKDEPLRSYIEADPWGECPLPYLLEEKWEFVRCRDCQQMFHTFILSPAWQERLYRDWVTDGAMREFEEKHGVSSPENKLENGRNCVRHLLRVEKLTRALRGNEPLRVLDFGCGWGQFLSAAALFGAEAYGVDRDVDRLNEASGRGIKVASGLDALPRDLRGRLDAISLFQVLEHLEEPRSVLEEVREWLRPGGLLILETPNCTGVRGFESPDNYRDINPLAHINAFTPQTLVGIASRAGYAPVNYVAAHVSADLVPVAKSALKALLPQLDRTLRPSTERYFQRPSSGFRAA